jgi:hypothetical protein
LNRESIDQFEWMQAAAGAFVEQRGFQYIAKYQAN